MLKKLLETISKIIIENIPFFIILGLLSLIDNNYTSIYQFKYVLQRYILPTIMSYNSGKLLDKKYGGILAVIVLNTVMINYNFQSFLEPIAIGIICGWFAKKYSDNINKLRLPGYEMIINNLGIALLGIMLSFSFYYFLPAYRYAQYNVFVKISKIFFDNAFLPLFAIIIEPAKVFFLNNLINHSFLSVIGFSELKDHGKSIFFLLETNPGPGLGILLSAYYFEKKNNNLDKIKETTSNIFIHLIGGIHEVYFPYVLRNMKLLIALIFGGISGIALFHKFHVGLVSIASPGSIVLITLLAPLQDKFFILIGIAVSALVSFIIASVILNKGQKNEVKYMDFNEIIVSTVQNLEICVACDAGMGSSAMGATLLRKKLEKENIQGIKVVNSSIDNIPVEANMIIVHKQLLDRLKIDKTDKDLFVINDFMDSVFYDALVCKIKELVEGDKPAEKDEKVKIPAQNNEDKKIRLFKRENIYLGLKRTDKESALKKAGEILVEKGYVEEAYVNSILEREKIANTYLDYGISIPHCTVDGIKNIKNSGIVVLQYPYGIDYGNGKIVYLIIAIASIKNTHMDILSKLSELLDDPKIAEQLSTTVDIEEVYQCFLNLEDENVK